MCVRGGGETEREREGEREIYVDCSSLKAVDEGKYVNQFYHGHIQLSKKQIVLVLDR